jgi:hypothetical protein
MERFYCLFLHSDVVLTDEREQHIAARHPDLLPAYRDTLASTLFDPDQVRRSKRISNALLFSRWFDEVRNGKYVVVVVITNAPHWIITAYMTKTLAEGDVLWTRN